MRQELSASVSQMGDVQSMAGIATETLQLHRERLTKAERAWFGRARRIQKARMKVVQAEERIRALRAGLDTLDRQIVRSQSTLAHMESVAIAQQKICEKLPNRNAIAAEMVRMTAKMSAIEQQIGDLQKELGLRLGGLVTREEAVTRERDRHVSAAAILSFPKLIFRKPLPEPPTTPRLRPPAQSPRSFAKILPRTNRLLRTFMSLQGTSSLRAVTQK